MASPPKRRRAPGGKIRSWLFHVCAYEGLIRRIRTIALVLILGIGLPVMLLVGSLVWTFAIPSPMMRWQVLQTLQIVHALWPPFLVMWLYSVGRTQSKILIENVIASSEILQ